MGSEMTQQTAWLLEGISYWEQNIFFSIQIFSEEVRASMKDYHLKQPTLNKLKNVIWFGKIQVNTSANQTLVFECSLSALDSYLYSVPMNTLH